MSDMTTCLNDLSYIPPNNEKNEPTQGDIGETSNELTHAKCNEFEELYVSSNEELYPGCDSVTRLDFMAKFTHFKVKGKLTDSIFNEMLKSSHTAKEMTWHATGKCTEPDKMQYPVDGIAWTSFDTRYPDFAAEPRNVRFGLADDGFNPFGNLSQSYSMWPVILTTYNSPLWLCMKESSLMLMLLIPCPKSLGKDIDVYLRPLIDDLKDLWALKGVKTIDVSTYQTFNMRVMLLWNIKDFPTQSSLSGWSGKGYMACPTCNEDTPSMRALEGGLIPNRWMYPFERYMKKLKSYVRNKAKPEGSIAEGYVAKEALTFSSHYFWDVMMKFNHPGRNVDCPPPTCHPGIHTYRAKFKSEFPNQDMKEEFPGWFGSQIRQRYIDKDPGFSVSGELFALAYGPTSSPISVNSCVVNGVRFIIHSRDEHRTTQNNCICSPGEKDGEMYYGQLEEILEFLYMSRIPHDLADSDDEVLVNDDDVAVAYSSEEED
ncbi:reverse transcriptase domain-containing protein [Tanacetum coccineum]